MPLNKDTNQHMMSVLIVCVFFKVWFSNIGFQSKFFAFENLALNNISILSLSVHLFSCKICNPHLVQIHRSLTFPFIYLWPVWWLSASDFCFELTKKPGFWMCILKGKLVGFLCLEDRCIQTSYPSHNYILINCLIATWYESIIIIVKCLSVCSP